MNKDNEVEKLTIEERKIIQILLKHLMMQRNEIAYMKNKQGLLNDVSVNSLKEDGSKQLSVGVSLKEEGSKLLSGDQSYLEEGSKLLSGAIPLKDDGSKLLSGVVPLKEDGSKLLSGVVPLIEDGSKLLSGGVTDVGKGSKLLFEGIPLVEEGSKGNAWLYSFFEEELVKALEQYIKNGNGESSVYDFYEDFVEAVAQKNAADKKRDETVIILKLEDTHALPVEIPADSVNVEKLANRLCIYLQAHAPWDMRQKIAREFLLLHNSGKATITELRAISLGIPITSPALLPFMIIAPFFALIMSFISVF